MLYTHYINRTKGGNYPIISVRAEDVFEEAEDPLIMEAASN